MLSNINNITLHCHIFRLQLTMLFPFGHSYFCLPNIILVLSICPSSSEYISFSEGWFLLKPQVWVLMFLSRFRVFLFFANDWAELYEHVMGFHPKRHEKACWKAPSVCKDWNCGSHMLPGRECHQHTESGAKSITRKMNQSPDLNSSSLSYLWKFFDF